MVLDCRRVNQHVRKPPVPDMGSGECLHRLESPPGPPVSIGTADIRNCFYQCGIPAAWWAEFVGFSALECAEVKSWGAVADIWGEPISEFGSIRPVFVVLPMGWSWSFWIVQALHAQFLDEAGFPSSRVVANAWPPPLLDRRPIALPHCDNLTILGLDGCAVDEELESLMGFSARRALSSRRN